MHSNGLTLTTTQDHRYGLRWKELDQVISIKSVLQDVVMTVRWNRNSVQELVIGTTLSMVRAVYGRDQNRILVDATKSGKPTPSGGLSCEWSIYIAPSVCYFFMMKPVTPNPPVVPSFVCPCIFFCAIKSRYLHSTLLKGTTTRKTSVVNKRR